MLGIYLELLNFNIEKCHSVIFCFDLFRFKIDPVFVLESLHTQNQRYMFPIVTPFM